MFLLCHCHSICTLTQDFFFHLKSKAQLMCLNHFPPPEMKQFLSNRRRDSHMNWFESASDWEQELERCGAGGWRVSSVNDRFEMSTRWSHSNLNFIHVSGFLSINSHLIQHEILWRLNPLTTPNPGICVWKHKWRWQCQSKQGWKMAQCTK